MENLTDLAIAVVKAKTKKAKTLAETKFSNALAEYIDQRIRAELRIQIKQIEKEQRGF